MADPIAEFKQGARAGWAAGNWDAAAELIADVGPRLLDRAGVEAGMEVLDVGTGSGGTVAIPAALRGAKVVGSDLTPENFPDARRRAAEADVEIDWVEADAESLPFDDARFDRVLSTFGHMFAPRHARAAAELVRVCRPGGSVATATWLPDGFVGGFFHTIAKHMPAPPDFVEPPIDWGNEDHVREMFEPHGLELEFDREVVVFEHPSADELTTFYEQNFGPLVKAREALGDAWPALRAEMVELMDSWNSADEGLRIEARYLVTVGRKPG